MVKKSKLTAVQQLVQTKATELTEAQTRAFAAEEKNIFLVRQVENLTKVVVDLKALVKQVSGNEDSNSAGAEVVFEEETASKRQPAVVVDSKHQYARTNPMMMFDVEQRKRRRRERVLLAQQRELDDIYDDLFVARWGG